MVATGAGEEQGKGGGAASQRGLGTKAGVISTGGERAVHARGRLSGRLSRGFPACSRSCLALCTLSPVLNSPVPPGGNAAAQGGQGAPLRSELSGGSCCPTPQKGSKGSVWL